MKIDIKLDNTIKNYLINNGTIWEIGDDTRYFQFPKFIFHEKEDGSFEVLQGKDIPKDILEMIFERL